MAHKRIKHTDQEWFDLIKECRTSKRTISDWCGQHGITPKALYYHTRRLQGMGYQIPKKTHSDTRREKQEIVCLDISNSLSPDRDSLAYSIADEDAAVIHVCFQGIHIEVMNHAGQEVLTNLFHALTESC